MSLGVFPPNDVAGGLDPFPPPSISAGAVGAPVDAQYVTLATNATLTNERVLTAGAGISVTDGGAGGAVTIAASAGTAINGLSKIAQVVCVGGETTITFASIPQTFTDLLLIVNGTDTSTGSSNLNVRLKINGDATAGNYTAQQFHEEFQTTNNGGTNASSAAGSVIGVIPGTSSNANAVGSITVTLPNYAATVSQKTVRTEYGAYFGSAGVPLVSGNSFWTWKSAAAINALVIAAGGTAFAAGTTATLYGLGGTTGGSASSVYTPGSVLFADSGGAIGEDNPNFFWNDANNRLGIGTNSPSYPLHVKGTQPYVIAETTSTASGINIDGGAFVCLNTAGEVGHIVGHNVNYTANNIFKPSQLCLESYQAGGTTINAWATGGEIVFGVANGTGTQREAFRIKSTGTTLFAAGSTTAGTAPLKFTSGALLSAPEAGAIEFLTDKFYGTITTGTARKELTLNDAALTAALIPYTTTNGRLATESFLQYDATNHKLNISFGGPVGDIGVAKSVNTGISMVVSNYTAGTTANAGFYAGDGTTIKYCGMIKYSSGWTTTGLFQANDGLFYTETGRLLVANIGASSIIFATGGSAAANERMQIDSAGKVGIGTTPSQVLHVKTATGNAAQINDAVDTASNASVSYRSNNTSICNITGTGSTWTPTFTLGAASQGVFDALGAGGALIMASNASGVVKIAAGGNATANEVANFSALGMKFPQLGAGLYFKEGTNAISGLATLVAGTVTVNTTKASASMRVYLTVQTAGGTQGFLRIASRTAGTSFTITSTNAADTSTVAWLIVEPA